MGQVPRIRYGLAGAGRLATHLAHYLHGLGHPVDLWSRTNTKQTVEQALAQADVLIIATPDRVIEPFLIEHPRLRDQGRKVIHCSGSLTTPLAMGVHPLMTFGQTVYDPELYERMAFVCEEGPWTFEELFPRLKNPHYIVPSRDRSLYHALCVLAGNDTVVLWQKFFGELTRRWNIPATAALPYLERVVAALRENPERALTGPLARGDTETLARDLRALEGDAFAPVFESVWKAYDQEHVIKTGGLA